MEALPPERRAAFARLPFPYHESRQATRRLANPEEQALERRGWIEFFRKSYGEAAAGKK